jgi:D-3-phosphoglycerate dehydrogenase / 2-oxoglutarate reductase
MQVSGNVLVCDAIDDSGISSLKKSGMNVDYKPEISHDELIKSVKNYEVIVVRSRTKITKPIIDAAEKVKIIARVGVGLDNIDTNHAEAKRIRVINAGEAAMNAVAELVIGQMIALARSIPRADSSMKNGKWMKKELMGIELKGKYLGIIGVGNIGRNVGRLAKGLRMNLLGYDIVPISHEYVREVGMITTDLNTLLASSDFITCHIPITKDTNHLINSDKLAIMKSTAFIINTSRGEVVDEEALLSALATGKIAGAALDVFEIEPPTKTKLVELPNVICSPHIAAQTREAQELASLVIAEKIIQIMRGVI